MIKVAIVEDDARFTELLLWALSQNKNIEPVGRYVSAEDALRGIPRASPDVILMDINLPGMTGIECLRCLKNMKPQLKARIVVLTGDPRDDIVFDALAVGADGYLTKDEVLKDLVKHIVALSEGNGAMSPKIVSIVIKKLFGPAAGKDHEMVLLSPKEKQVFTLLAQGKQYKEMADLLGISLNTVRKHLQNIYRKLKVKTRHDAIRWYGRQTL